MQVVLFSVKRIKWPQITNATDHQDAGEVGGRLRLTHCKNGILKGIQAAERNLLIGIR